ncbi:hypothetical protein C8R48DRAFT_673631 [Suillus tomentosus]|nr:hypothetical protein C8R48DRAFT_673631 [Suillus tomentosus]
MPSAADIGALGQVRDFASDPPLLVIHSFDVIKSGAGVDELKSGVTGGSVLQSSYWLGKKSRYIRADRHRLVGQELGAIEKLPRVYTEEKKQRKVSKLAKNELLLIDIGSTSTDGRVLSVRGDLMKIQLTFTRMY